jgi:protein-S-isoprenylcysteine O-methyltransferase Ste14
VTPGDASGVLTLLRHLGYQRNPLLGATALIALFEVTIIGLALIQAIIEARLGWPPALVCAAVWVVWTAWHSWLFPKNRLRSLRLGRSAYRHAFWRDIYPWVSLGFSQMWRPLLNGSTLLLFEDYWRGGPWPLRPIPMAAGLTLGVAATMVIIGAIRTIGIHNAAFLREFVDPDTFVPVEAGIYRRMLHPLFWSGIVYSVGLAITVWTREAIAVAAINIVYGVVYNTLEDRRLRAVFGPAYVGYAGRVPALPRIRR